MKTLTPTVTHAAEGCYVQSVKLELTQGILDNVEKAKKVIGRNPEFKRINILATGSLKEMYEDDINDLAEGLEPELDTLTGRIGAEIISITEHGCEYACDYKYSGGEAFYATLDI